MTYDVILADPPWTYTDRNANGERGAGFKYPLLSDAELARLDVPGLAAPDAVLMLWATCPRLPAALALMDAWGFAFVTVAFTWVKTGSLTGPRRAFLRALDPIGADLAQGCEGGARATLRDVWDRVSHLVQPTLAFGLGHHTRSNAELVLLGRRGAGLKRADAGVPQVVLAPRGAHSAKPPEVHARIERLYGPQRRLEMFARAQHPGWDVFGNQVEGSIEIPVRPLAR